MMNRDQTVPAGAPSRGGPAALARLRCWRDREPRSGPEHMAWDQVLYENAGEPWLRVYRWPGPEVTFGYFMRWQELAPCLGNRPATRRWTGGGLVEHGADWTFSLIVPRACEPLGWSPRASYETIHGTLLDALRSVAGTAPEALALMAPAADEGPGGLCFEKPVTADLLADGRKIAGGAQRRGRKGLLHQGSLHWPDPGGRWVGEFADRLANEVVAATPGTDLHPWTDWQNQVGQLVAERYGSDSWNRAR